jgi:hypothetical protein
LTGLLKVLLQGSFQSQLGRVVRRVFEKLLLYPAKGLSNSPASHPFNSPLDRPFKRMAKEPFKHLVEGMSKQLIK